MHIILYIYIYIGYSECLKGLETVWTLLFCLPHIRAQLQLQRWKQHLNWCITLSLPVTVCVSVRVSIEKLCTPFFFMCQIELCDLEFGGRHQSYA